MKQTNTHENMIRYGDSPIAGGRRRRRGYRAANYQDLSPEATAMNAHLRAAAYGRQDLRRQLDTGPGLTNGAMALRNRTRSFLHLGRQYDIQARDNFASEAILFALIVALAAWPIIHAVQALAARW